MQQTISDSDDRVDDPEEVISFWTSNENSDQYSNKDIEAVTFE